MSHREDVIRKAIEARGWKLLDIDHNDKRGSRASGYWGGWSIRIEGKDGEHMLTGFSVAEVLEAVKLLPDGGEE